MEGLLLFGLFFFLLLLGVPILTSAGITAFLFVWQLGLGIDMFSINFYAGIAKFPLLAIPFFILAGFIMERVGLSRRLVNLLALLVGPIPGGLGIVAILSCVLFGAVSGTGPADTAAIGAVMIPAMVKRGYHKPFAAALVASAATTDVLIPPSLAFVLYGVITETSISGLFAAGMLPGLLMGLVLVVPVYWISKKRGYGGDRWGTRAEIWQALKDASLGLLAPVIILGGIYGGFFTPTEAAIVAAIYGFAVGGFIYRNLTVKVFYEVVRDSALSSGILMIIVAFAGLLGWTGSTLGVMEKAAAAMLTVSTDPFWVLMMINVILLIAGCLMDGVSIWYIFTPIMIPIIKYFNWDFMWFGVVMALNLSIGTVTPPVALNLFVASNLANISMETISKAVLPFFLALLVALLITSYVPWLSLWFPTIIGLH